MLTLPAQELDHTFKDYELQLIVPSDIDHQSGDDFSIEPHEKDLIEIELNPRIASDDDLLNCAEQIVKAYQGGFDWADLGPVVQIAIDFINSYTKMSHAEKKESILNILHYVVDIVETPYLPENISEPIFNMIVPPFVDLTMQAFNGQIHALRSIPDKPSHELLSIVAVDLFATFNDNVEWEDLAKATSLAFQFMYSFYSLDNIEVRQGVIEILDDLIQLTDPISLPEGFIEPVFKAMVPSFVDIILPYVKID